MIEKTGFLAMEKWTGWHASIVMIEILNNNIDSGAIPIEKALSGMVFHKRALERSYDIKISQKMNRIDKSIKIGAILDELYNDTPIPLDHSSAYTLLVAVALSAQTTDKKVNQVTPRLFAKASTPEQMSNLKVATIQKLIQEIGLAPTKAKNLKKWLNK